MIRVRFNKSASTLSASNGQGSVAWLREEEANSLINAGICDLIEDEVNKEEKIIVQEIVKPARRRKTK